MSNFCLYLCLEQFSKNIIKRKIEIDCKLLEVKMPENIENTKSWPDLAIGLYDRLTGRGAEITYEFDNM